MKGISSLRRITRALVKAQERLAICNAEEELHQNPTTLAP